MITWFLSSLATKPVSTDSKNNIGKIARKNMLNVEMNIRPALSSALKMNLKQKHISVMSPC